MGYPVDKSTAGGARSRPYPPEPRPALRLVRPDREQDRQDEPDQDQDQDRQERPQGDGEGQGRPAVGDGRIPHVGVAGRELEGRQDAPCGDRQNEDAHEDDRARVVLARGPAGVRGGVVLAPEGRGDGDAVGHQGQAEDRLESADDHHENAQTADRGGHLAAGGRRPASEAGGAGWVRRAGRATGAGVPAGPRALRWRLFARRARVVRAHAVAFPRSGPRFRRPWSGEGVRCARGKSATRGRITRVGMWVTAFPPAPVRTGVPASRSASLPRPSGRSPCGSAPRVRRCW